jgi:hypothetical protein
VVTRADAAFGEGTWDNAINATRQKLPRIPENDTFPIENYTVLLILCFKC